MSYEDYRAALDPKVRGTWNLHQQFLGTDLHFFLMLSSAAGVGGNAGQANYAAGSTFLDAIARHRAGQGLPGVTLDLGVIQDVGHVAENKELGQQLERLGHMLIRENELLAMIESAILDAKRDISQSQVISGLGTGQYDAPWFRDAKFSHLRGAAGQEVSAAGGTGQSSGQMSLATQLGQAKTLSEATAAVAQAIIGKLSHDFSIAEGMMQPEDLLTSYGIDSLVAVELRNWILRHAKAEISIFDVTQSQTLLSLADKVAGRSDLIDARLKSG
jgi:acyl carrier protein